jgi:hypothetical protein
MLQCFEWGLLCCQFKGYYTDIHEILRVGYCWLLLLLLLIVVGFVGYCWLLFVVVGYCSLLVVG